MVRKQRVTVGAISHSPSGHDGSDQVFSAFKADTGSRLMMQDIVFNNLLRASVRDISILAAMWVTVCFVLSFASSASPRENSPLRGVVGSGMIYRVLMLGFQAARLSGRWQKAFDGIFQRGNEGECMAQFMICYLGGGQPSSPEEGRQHFAKYKEWLSSLGDAAVSPANPFKNTHTVNADGTVTIGSTTSMSGYTVIEVDSMDVALQIAIACPFRDFGGSLEVSELMQMTG